MQIPSISLQVLLWKRCQRISGPKWFMMMDGPKHSCYFLSTARTFRRLPPKLPLAATHSGSRLGVLDPWWGSLVHMGLTGTRVQRSGDGVVAEVNAAALGLQASWFGGHRLNEATSACATSSDVFPCPLFQNIVELTLLAKLHDCKSLSEAQLAEIWVLTQTWTSCVKTKARVHAVMCSCVTPRRYTTPWDPKKTPKRSLCAAVKLGPASKFHSEYGFVEAACVYASACEMACVCASTS